MAKAWISELKNLPLQTGGHIVPIGKMVDPQTVTYTTSSQSSALSATTKYIRFVADADAFVAIGDNPTATADSLRIPQDVVEFFEVTGGKKIAVYDGTS